MWGGPPPGRNYGFEGANLLLILLQTLIKQTVSGKFPTPLKSDSDSDADFRGGGNAPF